MNKKELIILGIIIIVVIAISSVLLFTKKKKIEEPSIDSIKYMQFSYSTGTMIDSNVSYEIYEKEGKYKAIIKLNGIPSDEAIEKTLDQNVIDMILDVLNEYNVISWNGFSKYDKDVLDGNSFLFSLTTMKGEIISASGYMIWPKNYQEVKDELYKIFDFICNSMEIM